MPGRLQMRFRGDAAGGGGRDRGGRAGGVGRSRRDAKRAESVSLLPNPVNVTPVGVDGAVRGGRLRQTAPETEAARHRPIDHFPQRGRRSKGTGGMDHFIRHRGGRFAGPEGDQSGDGHGEGAGYAVGEVGGQAGQRPGRRTRRRHFAAGGDAGAVGDLPARGFFADARESAGGLRSAERAVAPDSDAAPVAPAARFFCRQAGDVPAEDRTADEPPPDRAARGRRAVFAGEPDGTRAALQRTADQRDEFFPRRAGVGRPGGKKFTGADRGADRACADPRVGAGVRHWRGGLSDRNFAAGRSGADAAAQRRGGVRYRFGCVGDRDGAGWQVPRGDRGGRARGVARATFHASEPS